MSTNDQNHFGPSNELTNSPASWTYDEVKRCRICGNSALEPIIDLGVQALTGVFPRTLSEEVPSGPLQLVKCAETAHSCGLVQLRHSFPKSRMYGRDYGYRSGLNQSMVDHLFGLVSEVRKVVSLSPGDIVLDIGSNDGTLLSAFAEPGLMRVGIDPTAQKFRQFYPEGVSIIADFFSSERFQAEFESRKAKVVTSVAMFYDLEDPLAFMGQVHDILADDGVWVFEQSYLPTMLDTNSYDTICHEHLEYYSLKQIDFMAHLAGLKLLNVEPNAANGGSFRVTAAKRSSTLKENQETIARFRVEESVQRLESTATYESFCQRVLRHRDQLIELLDDTTKRGERVLGYGASTKGNVLLQFCNITPKQLPCIAEVNPDKFGCFTPNTGIPIVSEQEAKRMNPDALLVLPWHFRSFIVRREADFLASGHRLIFPLPAIDTVCRG
jgi:NDP-4-keto-2,6-dideoxyhexose 3-C-methyltransferase